MKDLKDQLCYCGDITRLGVVHRDNTFCDEEPLEVVVTKTEDGQIVAVTRQNAEGQIKSVIAQSGPANKELRGYAGVRIWFDDMVVQQVLGKEEVVNAVDANSQLKEIAEGCIAMLERLDRRGIAHITDERILQIRRELSYDLAKPWGATLAFARALIYEARK